MLMIEDNEICLSSSRAKMKTPGQVPVVAGSSYQDLKYFHCRRPQGDRLCLELVGGQARGGGAKVEGPRRPQETDQGPQGHVLGRAGVVAESSSDRLP